MSESPYDASINRRERARAMGKTFAYDLYDRFEVIDRIAAIESRNDLRGVANELRALVTCRDAHRRIDTFEEHGRAREKELSQLRADLERVTLERDGLREALITIAAMNARQNGDRVMDAKAVAPAALAPDGKEGE